MGTVTADRRLAPAVVVVTVALVLALVTGAGALVALAGPVAVVLARTTRHGDRAPGVAVSSIEVAARVVEGDEVEVRVALVWAGAAEVDVAHVPVPGSGLVPVPAGDVAAVAGVDGATVTLRLAARTWGRHGLGHLAVRTRRPGGTLVHDVDLPLAEVVRVLPVARRLDALLHPARPRVAAGAHPAPTRGPGTDFADLRPYQPGDRLRDLSWAASARSETPWVVVHHPERTGTVVLLLDGFVETGLPDGTLDRAARVVWSLARHHLAEGDRVGLAAVGARPTWLSPVAGRRARWQVLDALLRADPGAGPVADVVDGDDTAGPGSSPTPNPGSDRSDRGSSGRTARRDGVRRARRATEAVPADAFVVGVSALQSDAFVGDVVHHRRHGRPTAVIVVESLDLLAPASGTDRPDLERVARRLWRTEVDLRRTDLSRSGVRTVVVADDIAPAVALLASRPHRSTVVAS